MRETEEQQMIRDAVAHLVRDAISNGISPARDMDAALWGIAVDSGLAALTVAEDDGGLGLGATELCLVTEELGRGLLAGSFIWTTVVPSLLVGAAGDGELRHSMLEEIASGERTVTLADSETHWRGIYDRTAATATRTSEGHILNGKKINVCLCEHARTFLMTAQTDGRIDVFVVPASAAGLEMRVFDTLDAGQAAEVSFKNVMVAPDHCLQLGDRGQQIRQQAWDLGLLGVAAECVGIMKSLIRLTADYLIERKQFGQPLARFQVLRHQMADMALARMSAEALMVRAAVQFASLSASDRTRLVAATCSKAFAGAKFVAERAVHLHGGMGITKEVPIGYFLRRILALEALCGSADYFRTIYRHTAVITTGKNQPQ